MLGSFPPGFIDVNGPLFSGGAFCRRVFEDSVHLPVLNEGVVRGFTCNLGLPLYPNFLGQSGVEHELSEISFIDQVLKMSSEGSTVHCEVAPPFMEGTVVSRSKPFWVRWEKFGRMSDP